MSEAAHLVKRFFGSLRPGGPPPADAVWAEQALGTAEVDLWRRMSRADRRHAVGVARRVEDVLGPEAGRLVLAAALLHDVGKISAGIGTFGRSVATVVIKVTGRGRAASWAASSGVTGRIGRYSEHPRLGAQLLEQAGSDPLVVAWTREHHRPKAEWTVPRPIGAALKASDDD